METAYNLSEMSREAAEDLVRMHEGERLCVRFYRRRDGTVITNECPVALRALKRRVLAIGAFVSTIVGLALTCLTSWIDSHFPPTPPNPPIWVRVEDDGCVMGQTAGPRFRLYVPPGEPMGTSLRSCESD